MNELGDIFHRHKIRRCFTDQPSEMSHQPPSLLARRLLSLTTTVGRERLARGASRKKAEILTTPQIAQLLTRNLPYIELHEACTIICFIRKSTRRININSGYDPYAALGEAVSQTP